MKKIVYSIIAILSFAGIAYAQTAGIPITVPSAPGAGYGLLSTTTGRYSYTGLGSLFSTTSANYWLVSTSSPLQVGSITATSTTANNVFMGNVGIGDTAPGVKLSVVGNEAIGYSSGQTAPSNGLIINGNVGIGTTAPSNLLTVSGVGVPMLVHSSGVYTGIQMTSSGDVNGGVGFVEGYDSFQVQPGGNYALNVSSNGSISVGKSYGSMGGPADGAIFQGSVGIGDTAPGTKLSVVGNATIGYASGQTAPANGMIINGNVGIGTTTPASTLTVNGHIGTDGLAPALTSCGTSPSIVAGSTDTAGEVTEGSLATGCTITFKTAYARAPFVTISAQSGLVFSYTISASAITITNVGALSSTILDYHVISNDE